MIGSVLRRWLAGGGAHPLGHIQRARGHALEDIDQAQSLRTAAERMPGVDTWIAAARAEMAIDDYDAARNALDAALGLSPGNPAVLAARAQVAGVCGEVDEAIDLYRQSLIAGVTAPETFQSMLFLMLCSARTSDAEIRVWHERFARQWEDPLRSSWPGAGIRQPDAVGQRRLRVAYLSRDLRDHVTGRFFEPLLAHCDRSRFEIHCYHDARVADGFTAQLRSRGGRWHDMARLDDEALARHIRAQKIDILVDLSGHTPGNRVLAVARHPAPVQVSYLDYSATTGLASVGYRLTTASLDPVGEADAFYTERLVRLPYTYWVYNPAPVPPASAVVKDWLLFGCLNSFSRVNEGALQAWAQILKQVPASRLALVGVPAGQAQERLVRRLSRLGVPESRLELFGFLNHGHYLQLVQATDIALAPFPYNGATTLMDCLWQGTPVVSMRGGPTFRSAMGRCIHGLVGLDDLLAGSPDEYVRSAVGLARDAGRREVLRASLRSRMQASPLRDGAGFARSMEDALVSIWAGAEGRCRDGVAVQVR